MNRIVIDTNILISALGWTNGKERAVINLCISEKFQLVESPKLLDEFIRVVSLPKFDFIPNKEKLEFISLLTEISEVIVPSILINQITDDPSDNRVLECAVAGRATHIVSGDKHLLMLKTFGKIKIVNSANFLLETNRC